MDQPCLSHARLRRRNRARVLLEIQKGEASTRTRIAGALGLSLMGVTRVVRELIAAGLVEEGAKSPSNSVGRPGVRLTLSPGGAYVLGLSINAYEPSVSLANIRGEVIQRRPIELDGLADSSSTISQCGRVVKELIADSRIPRKRIVGLGTVIGGVVDTLKGEVLAAPFLGWGHTEIAAPLRRALGLPVVVETLDNALLLAEVRFGIAAGQRNVLFVRSAVGLGGGLLIDGQLIRGTGFQAGQIGHMPVKGETRICSCGRTGCLNTVSSGGAVLAQLGLASTPIPSAKDFVTNRKRLDQVLQAAAAGDKEINQVLFRAGQCLGETFVGLAVATDPEQILLAGPLARCASYQEGFRAGVSQILTNTAGLIALSTIDHCHAAALLALSELVLSERLTFGPLRHQRARAGYGLGVAV